MGVLRAAGRIIAGQPRIPKRLCAAAAADQEVSLVSQFLCPAACQPAPLRLRWFVASLLLPFLATSVPAQQPSRVVPSEAYSACMAPFNEGEYETALRAFRSAASTGVRTVEGRWIDGICYHAMMGECYYHMGNLAQALEQYNAACTLYLAHHDWMTRVQWPEAIRPSGAQPLASITWGASGRNPRLGAIPDKFSSFQGRLDNEDVLRRGGVVAPPMLYPIRADEIVRCTALAIRRRNELLGPIGPHDATTARLIEALAARPSLANHWSQAWVSAQLGMAYAGAGKLPQAVAELKAAERIGGVFDHSLTGMALLELGKIAFIQKQYDLAASYFLEATFAGVHGADADVIEEGFRYGMVTHLVSGKKALYPPLTPAARADRWAQTRSLRALQASLNLLSAENHLSLGSAGPAAAALDEAARLIARREMRTGEIGARHAYQSARLAFAQGKLAAGEAALADAMTWMRSGGRWLFQIALADRLFASGGFTERVADQLYEATLRDPAAADWAINPMETLAVTLANVETPMEHWFVVALSRKENEKALEISERVKRRRFFSTLPLGGRLLALRWVLQAPLASLSADARLQRQDLRVKFPGYAEVSRQADQAAIRYKELPLKPSDGKETAEYREVAGALAAASTTQELLLRTMALGRNPSEFVFPPLRTVKEIRKRMPEGQLAICYFATSRFVYAFMFTNERYAHWQVEAPGKIQLQTRELLKRIGNVNGDFPIGHDVLGDDKWREVSTSLLQLLTRNAPPDFWGNFDEVVIIPDAMLWYVPFEALQLPERERPTSLLSAVRVRYLPMASLLISDDRGRAPVGESAIVVGKLFPRDDKEAAQQAAEELRAILPDAVILDEALPVPSGLAVKRLSTLVVLDDVTERVRGPYDWSPARIDEGKPGAALGAWMSLPFGSPDVVVLPGFHTAAEDALKDGGGPDLFLSICGLMASGTRTVLISRWRTGGRTASDLMREFVQEAPHQAASAAWQRAVLLAMDTEIDPLSEPRVKLPPTLEAPKASHPFFWAGYLVSDIAGSPPAAPEE